MLTFDAAALKRLIIEAVREVLAEQSRDDGYMSTGAAAKFAEVSPAWIRGEQDAGRLGIYHAGRERRVKRSELEALLRGSAEPTPEELAREQAATTEVRRAQKSISSNGGGVVYFIQRGGDDGPIKIGWTTDIQKRLANLQTGVPEKLRLIGLRAARSAAAEAKEHARWAHLRYGEDTEWFAPDSELLSYARSQRMVVG